VNDSSYRGRARRAKKAGIASFIGTTVKWFDFYAYSTATAQALPQALEDV